MDWFMGKSRRKDKETAVITQDDNKYYLSEDFSGVKVLDRDWDELVSLPLGIDQNEWLATHTIAFFDHINMLYGSVSEFCTSTGCVTMTAPCNVQYQWVDEKGKKCKCTAPQYVEYVMTFIKKTIHDESVFPTKYGNVFPPSFEILVKKIHRLLFHVLAHIYQAHYKEAVHLSIHPHLNTVFEHFMTFSQKFGLIDEKETEILDDLYQRLHTGARKDGLQKSSSESAVSGLDSNCLSENSDWMAETASEVKTRAARPTSLTYIIKQHQSSNGSCPTHCDDNKENVCDKTSAGNTSQSGTPPLTMST